VRAKEARLSSNLVTRIRLFPTLVGFVIVCPAFARTIFLSSVVGILALIGIPSCLDNAPGFLIARLIQKRRLLLLLATFIHPIF